MLSYDFEPANLRMRFFTLDHENGNLTSTKQSREWRRKESRKRDEMDQEEMSRGQGEMRRFEEGEEEDRRSGEDHAWLARGVEEARRGGLWPGLPVIFETLFQVFF